MYLKQWFHWRMSYCQNLVWCHFQTFHCKWCPHETWRHPFHVWDHLTTRHHMLIRQPRHICLIQISFPRHQTHHHTFQGPTLWRCESWCSVTMWSAPLSTQPRGHTERSWPCWGPKPFALVAPRQLNFGSRPCLVQYLFRGHLMVGHFVLHRVQFHHFWLPIFLILFRLCLTFKNYFIYN